jgi:CubicO group peptidase (beta-lactamase class C family)
VLVAELDHKAGDYLSLIAHFPLVSDPGAEFHYSNLTSDWLVMIVTRACGTDLKPFAQEHLFAPLGVEIGDWTQDAGGYYIVHGEMHFPGRLVILSISSPLTTSLPAQLAYRSNLSIIGCQRTIWTGGSKGW